MTDLLTAYEGLIVKWAPRLDLVSLGDLGRLRDRHIDDSLRLAPLLDELGPGTCCDVGSGAGLPGIPLAIVRPERSWRLFEPRVRRVAFLEEAIRELDLTNCSVIAATAEQAATDPSLAGGHVVAVARALAAPARALALLLPLVAPGGAAVTFVGQSDHVPDGAEEWRSGIAIVRRDRSGERTLGNAGRNNPQ